jgi:hypothetical protein
MSILKTLGFIALLTSITAYATLTEYSYITKYGYTGDVRTIEWCQPDREDYPGIEWEVEIRDFEANQVVQRFTGLTDTSVTWIPPRSGHYTFRVRNHYNEHTSNWVEGTNGAESHDTCGPVQQGWWLFVWIKPVDEVIILP